MLPRNIRLNASRRPIALSGDVWKKRHEAGALDGGANFPLVACGHVAFSRGDHARVRRQKRLEVLNILIINVFWQSSSSGIHRFLVCSMKY